jgi:tryptophan synthase beta chain
MASREGVLPALETAHAVAHAVGLASTMREGERVLINVSGRGDKDVNEVARLLGKA